MLGLCTAQLRFLGALWQDRRAVTTLEYGLLAFLIAGVAAVGVPTLGNALNAKLTAFTLVAVTEVPKL